MSSPDFQSREAKFQKLAELERTLQVDADTATSRFDNLNRQLIVVCVMLVYTGVVVLTALYLVIYGASQNKSAFADLSELVKIAILPIVTLVIGYYFGSKTQNP